MDLTKPQILTLPKICDPRGNLSFVENGSHLPFDIARVYWIYDVPGGEERGSHAHKVSQSLMVSAGGSFDVYLSDGRCEERFCLNRPYQGLYIPSGYWRRMENFSSGAVCMVLTSTLYSEDDYIRDYDEFLHFAGVK